MQASFHLRKDKVNKDGQAPVRVLISVDGKKIFKIVSGVKCIVSDWDYKKERIKPSKKTENYNFYIEYNKIIDDFETNLKNIFRYVLTNNIDEAEFFIKEKLEDKKSIEVSIGFISGFEEFLAKNRSTKAERTTKGYTTILNFLNEFSKNTNYKLNFDRINLDFFDNLRDYCFEEKKIGSNYFAKIVQVIKTYMKWAFERDYHSNLTFKKFRAPEKEIEIIYLTMKELLKLYNHNFDSERLNNVKNTYCFGCSTGLRFSDIKQLKSSNIIDGHIKINIKKTKTIDHIIPLNPISKSVLDKYKNTIYEPLPVISGQKFNEYLKECCKIVKIDTPTTISRYSGQKRIDKTVPKYELITSHTARKTFVTNSLALGMTHMTIRDITGHKKEANFMKYLKISDDLKKQEMDNTWGNIVN